MLLGLLVKSLNIPSQRILFDLKRKRRPLWVLDNSQKVALLSLGHDYHMRHPKLTRNGYKVLKHILLRRMQLERRVGVHEVSKVCGQLSHVGPDSASFEDKAWR